MPSLARVRLRQAIRRSGFDLAQRQPQPTDLLRERGVRVVFDVGANEGQFAQTLRAWGYGGRIVSVEPGPAAAARLRARAAADPQWDVVECALGREAGTATLHVSRLSVFSSLRQPLPAAHAYDERAATVESVDVPVRRLDDLFDDYVRPGDPVYLKVDTQGSEPDVLDGARGCLDRVAAVQLELGVVALYEGERMADHLIARMSAEGFRLGQVHPVGYDPTDGMASLLQFDAVFVRPPPP